MALFYGAVISWKCNLLTRELRCTGSSELLSESVISCLYTDVRQFAPAYQIDKCMYNTCQEGDVYCPKSQNITETV